MPETFFISSYDSPVGRYLLASSERGMVCVKPEERKEECLNWWEKLGIQVRKGGDHNLIAATEMHAYFMGDLHQFTLPLDLRGTDFQLKVWAYLGGIPYGEVKSYGDVATAIGNPKACRAVGLANGRNPVSIIVPCHRVIGADGSLVGYGGGLERKRALLDLEARFKSGKH
jgi:O-6-methylguanine DNA methyltransferase